jgi:hypothetical protein
MSETILEKRSFRLLPDGDIGFAKPALEFDTSDGKRAIRVCHDFKAPEPEMARKANDPGYWTVNVWLPLGATPVALVPDPSALTL